jgi:hypothetical protein
MHIVGGEAVLSNNFFSKQFNFTEKATREAKLNCAKRGLHVTKKIQIPGQLSIGSIKLQHL